MCSIKSRRCRKCAPPIGDKCGVKCVLNAYRSAVSVANNDDDDDDDENDVFTNVPARS